MLYDVDLINSFVYINISFVISFLLLILNCVLSLKFNRFNKNTAYECGFEPFKDSRGTYDIQFYIVAVLFIIFDFEIAYMFPWAACSRFMGFWGFCGFLFFFIVLILGFIYEWYKGVLVWNNLS
jgi:NADH-quinone oxidoreductase subunit A